MPRNAVTAGTLGVTCVAAAVDIAVAVAAGRQPPLFYASEIIAAAVWWVVGTLASAIRRDYRVGQLMQFMGLVFMVNAPAGFALELRPGWVAADYLLARAANPVQIAVLAHLLLSYPSGRLSSPAQRALFVVAYGYAGVTGTAAAVDALARAERCGWSCASTPGEIAGSGTSVLWNSGWWVLAAVCVVLLGNRIRRATPRERRILAYPLLMALLLVLLFLVTVAFAATGVPRLLVVGRGVNLAMEYLALLATPGAFLAGLIRERLSYASVADLIRVIDGAPVGQLQAALRKALTDPGLVLAFPRPHGYVDEHGAPVPLPDPGGRPALPIGGDPPIAVALHDKSLVDEPELLSSAAAAARLALDNARLHALVRAQLAEVRASRRRILDTGVEQRRRLERDLHDGAQQRLLGAKIALQLIELQLTNAAAVDAQAVREAVQEAQRELQAAIDELRELARGIHPAVLTEQGLVAAVHSLAARAPLPVSVHDHLARRAPAPVEATAYFIVNEALANVVKHAGASSAAVRLDMTGDRLRVQVRDDGAGGADTDRGSGLRGLQDRALAFDGTLTITSPPGGGTDLVAELRCE